MYADITFIQCATRLAFMPSPYVQGAYNSGKPGQLRDFFNSGKLWKIWNILWKFLKIRWYVSVTQSETHNKPSIDWLCDTLTGVGGAGHHAP